METKTKRITPEQINQSFKQASEINSAYNHILPFFESVFIMQETAVDTVNPEMVELSTEMVEAKINGELPLLERSEIPSDQEAAIQLLKAICTVAPKTNFKLQHTATAIETSFSQSNDAAQRGFNLFLSGNHQELNQLAEELVIEPEPFKFFLYNSLFPSIAKHERQLSSQHPTDKNWKHGYCPICGGQPNLSFLSDNGERFLICEFCRHQWSTERIHCPHCRNNEPEKLSYFFSNDEKTYRVYTCDSCKTYLKTVDTRELSRPFYPPLESIITTHLDIQAQKMGYKSPQDVLPV